jgi:hypothetical protein
MVTIEDRLRRTFDTVAARTVVAPAEPADVEGERPRRRSHPMVVVALVAAVVVIAAVVALTTGGTRHRVVVTDGGGEKPTSVPPTTLPATPIEQHLESVPVPAQLQGSFAPTGDLSQVAGTRMQAFSIDGTSPFAVGDIAASDYTERFKLPTSQCIISPRPDGQKTATCSGGKSLVATLSRFPRAEDDTVVWHGLPTGTAYVTLQAPGEFLRQTPLLDTVAFMIDARPVDPRARIDHLARLRAYDARGRLLDDAAA